MTSAGPMNLRLPALPPRTRLYHLEPLGVGTPQIESLSGYVMRLAEAHSVTTSALVGGELLPVMQPQGLGARPAATWLLDEGPRFNGTGDTARMAIDALATLTGRRDLMLLTLWPWAQVLAPYGLVRLKKQPRAWCRACYADALDQARPLYEPLLWSIAVVTVCPRHRVRLSTRCPYDDCARALPLIAAATRPGYCSWCKRLLYRPGDALQSTPTGVEETGWGLWVAQQIGTLLALAPSFPRVSAQAVDVSALEAFVHARCGHGPGAYTQFARLVGIHVNLLCRWRKGRGLPTIDLLLRVCHALGVSLGAFLSGDTSSLPGQGAVGSAIAPPSRRRSPRPAAKYDTERLRQGIDALLSERVCPPPSIAEAARRLGCTSAVLARLFPDTCRGVADRYKAYRTQQRDERVQHLAADIKEVMRQFDAAGIYPASKRVRAQLQRRVHPRNSDYNRIRRQLLHEFGWSPGGTRIAPPAPLHDKSTR